MSKAPVTTELENLLLNPDKSFADPGYYILPGGLIIQWGRYAGGVNGLPQNFPITFPNAVLGASATSNADNGNVAITSLSTTQIAVTQIQHGVGNSTDPFYWVAWGH